LAGIGQHDIAADNRGTVMKKLALLATAGALVLGSAASADDGDDNAFKLVNQSKVTATIMTTMLTSGQWSNNWLATPLSAGQTRAMRFKAGDDRCEIRTRVAFSDGSEFDTKVNYCGTESVILTDQNLYVK
jgi:hypothetical protein